MSNLTPEQLFSYWVSEVKRMKSEKGITEDQYTYRKGNNCVWVSQGISEEYWVLLNPAFGSMK